jgi:plasmid stability protein
MASLSIRKLEDTLYERLRIRAAKHGVSMEEEVRKIISRAVLVPDSISEVFFRNFGVKNGIDLELLSHIPHEPMEFEK